ncbi:two-component system, OmpR family, phosphate regulon sensor histidine kinase PhoR [Roseivivax halotolerans]|jgi:two-component system phosphate regulon sensor histidine kinase PhoR|uniref:histidine kinase n=1 Tax=Roseivivax halotolerans TaxID=93684 RepID=A0A1I5ZZU6_9RHOB|nr:ATP-binding protein [Roseivivax halotolerans]SFQ61787.1 two-component system, OmpR family, phosphate regulon sensor histidine kinase PhoR [Roseivivax halotolerans]
MTPTGFLEALPIAALLIRRDERIEAANALAQNLLGKGLMGRHFITALRQPAVLDAVESVMRDGKPKDARYLTNDGQQDTTFRVSVRAVPGSGILVSFEDETTLERAMQMRRDFVANVSHELKTPLTALISFIETLRGPARDDAAARDRFLNVMGAEAERMNRLIADLLSLSRVEAEERVRPTARLDLASLVKSVALGLSRIAEDAGVEIATDTPPEVEIRGDSDQLRQVLVNLTENAIKYAGKGARVTITVTHPGYEAPVRDEGVRIVVSDTGAGIDPVHLPRLTERFYRVDSDRSREKGGTGLGLAIVKHIVNRHRGRIRVDSTPGEGTEVTVILPR